MKDRIGKFKDPALLLAILDRPQSPIQVSASRFLEGLESLYSKCLSLYLASESIGVRRRMRAPVPIISIGNLSVGGTGKTPATIALAKAFQSNGVRVAVLSRGHGGTSSKSGGVVSDDEGNILLGTDESGDEPIVLARALPGVPILVGKDRRISARMAVERFKPDLLLLDDGFQYWQLWRDADIVLLDAFMPFANGHCLPRGLLREPKVNLNRAQFVVITRSATLSIEEKQSLRQEVAALAPQALVYFANHSPGECLPANNPAFAEVVTAPSLAVSAIAKPDSFIDALNTQLLNPLEHVVFPDHFRYQKADAARIVGKMKEVQAEILLTTQKDFVKLGPLLPTTPIFVQHINFEVEDIKDLLSRLLARTILREPVFLRQI